LDKPISALALKEWIKPGGSHLHRLHGYHARKTPNQRLIPWLFGISGALCRESRSLCFNGLGTHRAQIPRAEIGRICSLRRS
jgi:hypothetical protein